MMKIHRTIGLIFSSFCSALFIWHLSTPENPHHDIAVLTMSLWSVLFLVSSFVDIKVSRIIQPVTLLIGSFVTVYAGNFPVAAIISVISALIYWAYGGFHELNITKAIITFLSVFLTFFIGVVVSGHGYSPAYGIAFFYTILSSIGFSIVWMIFLFFASDIVQQNRDLLELSKQLKHGECNDVATKRR